MNRTTAAQRPGTADVSPTDVDVVIIGTRFAGIGMGAQLKRHGRECGGLARGHRRQRRIHGSPRQPRNSSVPFPSPNPRQQ
ncbi:hypothetical protein [Streptomyces sp. NPDC052036]|uniref:hypothetical protein n=1 Tax=unclassified Streptomyces TaxID=2593676 RepID=UPI00342F049C